MQHFLVQVKLKTKKLLLFKKSLVFFSATSIRNYSKCIIMSINVQDFKRVMLSNDHCLSVMESLPVIPGSESIQKENAYIQGERLVIAKEKSAGNKMK